MARLFGTDGVRGVANVKLHSELAFKLGYAAAKYFGAGFLPEKLLSAGIHAAADKCWKVLWQQAICNAGGNAHLLGVMPFRQFLF